MADRFSMGMSLENYLKSKSPDISWASAQAVISLSEEGATVPFIARYRKEKTGNLDEVQVRAVLDNWQTYEEVVKRKAFISQEIEKQGGLSEPIELQISKAMELAELDEIYRPFKKKKKTKATLAKEAGLMPLADWIWSLGQETTVDKNANLEVKAKGFLNSDKGIVTFDLALQGAQDILVERIYNDPDLRQFVREDYFKNGKVSSKKGKKYKENSKYEMYADFQESVSQLLQPRTSYRYLAMRRGWQEKELVVSIKGQQQQIDSHLEGFVLKTELSLASEFLKKCVQVAFVNHLHPSICNEVHSNLKEQADIHAINVFKENVRKLLLAAPFGAKCVLGVDPGLRTGCKVALVNKGGEFVSHTILHAQGDGTKERAKKLISELTKQITLDAIAVGNGTAGRETEKFLREVVKDLALDIPVILVNESGASVYSASGVARQEFPDLDLTIRGAISIARRLQDPLAELVKIEPKSIGVGQYQHDVNAGQLKKGLEAEVESCVNSVGVDVNTASTSLLSYVSGIGPALAKNIVEYRGKKGLFKKRDDLKSVERLSEKVFEQSAGFLRIYDGENILDRTGIHPESYSSVEKMAAKIGSDVSGLLGEETKKILDDRLQWIESLGEHTFMDIIKELQKPGYDPRDPYKVFEFRQDIHQVADLKEEMICPGIVTNVTIFGAFVDIGVHQDGLVHLSELSNTFITNPREIVSPGDQVQVKILKINKDKNQISLSMKVLEKKKPAAKRSSAAKRTEKRAPASEKGSSRQGERKNFSSSEKNRNGSKPRKPSRTAKGKPSRGSSSSSSRPSRRQKPSFNNPFAAALSDLEIKK